MAAIIKGFWWCFKMTLFPAAHCDFAATDSFGLLPYPPMFPLPAIAQRGQYGVGHRALRHQARPAMAAGGIFLNGRQRRQGFYGHSQNGTKLLPRPPANGTGPAGLGSTAWFEYGP
jgi:hypothetical protein